MMSRPPAILIRDFGSLRTYPDPADIGENDFSDERNTARAKDGVLQRRRGWTPVLRTALAAAVQGIFDYVDYEGTPWTMVYANGNLYRVQPDPGSMWIQFATGTVASPAVCYNADNDEFGIVYRVGSTAYLVIRSADGLTERLAATTLATSICTSHGPRALAVDWDGSNYGVLYGAGVNGDATFLSVSRAGAIISGPTDLGLSEASHNVAMRWNGTHFGITYKKKDLDPLYFSKISTVGAIVGSEVTFANSEAASGHGLDTDGVGWMAVYRTASGGDTKSYAEYIGADGVSDGKVALSQSFTENTDQLVKWNGESFLAFYGSYAAKVTSELNLLANDIALSVGPVAIARRGDGLASLYTSGGDMYLDLLNATPEIFANGAAGLTLAAGTGNGTSGTGSVSAVVSKGYLGVLEV